MTYPTVSNVNGDLSFNLVVGFSSSRPSRNIIRELMGDPADPATSPFLVDMRVAGSRVGSLVMLIDGLTLALEIEHQHSLDYPMTLTAEGWPNGGMTYVVGEGDIELELDPETQAVWLLTVPFVEVTP